MSIPGSFFANAEAPAPDGAAAPADPLSRVTAGARAHIGGDEAQLLFQWLAPGLAGLYRLNVPAPGGVPAGDRIPLAVESTGASHDQVDIAVTR